ncbi:hypothetical protein GALMADRAFT_257443 [Galerina marginata CBS 339.88]|uniref:ADF-H domain-containing protein n=1 Tax=Galerina marginata (strain CBS 339.88) TaxID=685588 RepID=A0A067SAS5_GALM3|nr:hypothetical protein GALMADRAFT_257443 [Galerina marginata CBS 339.88]
MSDPAAVMSAYSSILDHNNNWLLLHYVTDLYDEMGLHSFGNEGLEELKTKLADLNEVFIAFYCEELDVDPGFIIINYIPPHVLGVKRARALVHSRRVGTIFKRHQTIFTVDSLSLLTAHNIHQAIVNPEAAFPSVNTDIQSHIADPTKKPLTEQRETVSPVGPRVLQPTRQKSQPAINPKPPLSSTNHDSDATPKSSSEHYEIVSSVTPRALQPVRAKSQQPIRDPSTTSDITNRDNQSQLADATNKPLPDNRDTVPSTRAFQPVRTKSTPPEAIPRVEAMPRRSFTATYAPQALPDIPPVPPLPAKGGSRFTNFLRRKKNITEGLESDLPPPTPPKDRNIFPVQLSNSTPLPSIPYPAVRRQRSRSMSDFAVISHVKGSQDLVVEQEQDEQANVFTLPLRGKWAHEATLPNDPAERARRRRELQLQREKEEREALEEEAERQRRIKLEKEELIKQEVEEEARRKAEVEQEIRRITAERKRRERLEQEDDEQRRRSLEDRRKVDRERRLEEHRRLEEWRKEQAKKEEAAARQAEAAKRREEAERKKKIQQAEAKAKGTAAESELTGWITVQSKDGLSWKRRFYKFAGKTVFLYRSPKEVTTPLEEVDLRGKLRGLKEWNEGYDDLEAIAFAFVVEFKNGHPDDHWSMYADSEEEKYKILGLFKVAAGL